MKLSIAKSSLSVLIALSLFTYACGPKLASGVTANNSDQTQAYSPAGIWEYELETPQSTESGILTIVEEGGVYSAVLEIPNAGVFDFQSFQLNDKKMTGSVDILGSMSKVEVEFDEDTFTGTVVQNGISMQLEGVRVDE